MDNSKKIRRISAVDQVSDGILDLIKSNNMMPGDKLPTEVELADMFGVNRFTVRMSLQKLITIGIIETRVGEGSFVKRFNVRTYFNQIGDIGFANESMEDIYHLRFAIEGSAIKLAIQNASRDELEELRQKAEACKLPFNSTEQVTEEQCREAVERDIAFHQYLCICSHNKIFEKLYILLVPQLKEYITRLIVIQQDIIHTDTLEEFENHYVNHLRLAQAIADKDSELSAEILNDMISPFAKG